MANKYGPKGIPVDWDTIKTLYVSGKPANEIAGLFNIQQNTIETRAKRGRWSLLRKQARLAREKNEPASNGPIVSRFEAEKYTPQITTRGASENATDAVILQRVASLGDSTSFRTRVIKANDSALKVLEENPPTNVGECDRFAEALTKVERIGARTFGYDREAETPIINIAMLTSSDSNYDLN